MKKLRAILNCIKDSETILGGEYYIVHSDYIIALEEEIKKLNTTITLDIKGINGEKVIDQIKRSK